MSKRSSLTHARLCEVLDYSAETGLFVWRVTRGKAIKGCVAGHVDAKTGYIVIGIDRVLHLGHRLAWLFVNGVFPHGLLDHRNRVPSDNRISNLRIATGTQNAANKTIGTTNRSGYKGVSWHKKAGKWQASIKIGRRSFGLGLYGCPVLAHAAYRRAAEEKFKEFACAG